MADRPVREAASAELLGRQHELALAITDALYRERPDLLTRWGAEGRAKCLQDIHHNLEHLAPAVSLGEPELFARYVVWLRAMLGARGIPERDIADSLRRMRVVVAERLTADSAAAVDEVLDAGLAVL